MQMVCIISCNNPVQAAPRRLNSSNRASDQAHSQRQARAGCCRRQRLTSPGPLAALSPGAPSSPVPGQRGASSQLWEMPWRAGGFAAGGGYAPPPCMQPS